MRIGTIQLLGDVAKMVDEETLGDITERKLAELLITQLATTVESIDDAVAIIGLNRRIVYANSATERLYGYREGELIGRPVEILINLSPNQHEEIWKIASQRGKWDGELAGTRRNGSSFPIQFTVSTIKNGEEKPIGHVGIAKDLTECRESADEIKCLEEFNEELVQKMDEGVMTLDEGSRITFLNPKALAMLGYTKGELKGEPFGAVCCCNEAEVQAHLDKVKGRQSVKFECIMKTKDGGELTVFNNCAPIMKGGKFNGYLSVLTDVTEWKVTEEAFIEKSLKYDLAKGNVYLSEEPGTEKSMDAFLDLLKMGYKGMVITRHHPEEVRERYRLKEEVPVYWLGTEAVQGANVLPPEFPVVEKEVRDFFGRKKVVLIDRLEYLASQKGFEEVLAFVQRLHELAYAKKGIVLLSLDPATFPPHLLALARSETQKLERKEGPAIPEDLREILEFVHGENREGRKPTNKAISKRFGFSRATRLTKLKQLKALGLIADEQRGRMKLAWVTEKGKDYL